MTFIITIVLALIAIAVFFFAGFLVNENRGFAKGHPNHIGTGPLWLLGIVFSVLTVVSLGLVMVPAGYVGVVTNFGHVEERTLLAGLSFVTPVVETVHEIDTRVQPHDFKDIDAASQEYQSVKASGKLNYHIDPAFAFVVYRQLGEDFASKVIDPALNDFIKEEMPKFAITQILPQRDKIRADTIAAMNTNLARYHIVVDDIYLANISFSTAYEKAIEDKQVAQQGVQTEEQILAQKKIQADQAVVDATGKANAAVALAQGQAKANDLLAASLSANLIQYTAITKLNDKISVILLPASGNFLLDTKSLLTNP